MRSLYKRQLTMMVGVMVLSFTLLSTAFMLLSYRYIISEKRDAMARNASYIATFTASYYQQYDSIQDKIYSNYVASIARISDSYVIVTTPGGEIIYATDGDHLYDYKNTCLPKAVVDQVLHDGDYTGMTNLDGIYPERRYMAALPVSAMTLSGRTVVEGLVLVSADASSLAEMWSAMATIFFFSAVVVLIISVIASTITSAHQARPLNEMAEAARKFGRGEFDVRVTGYEGRCDEISTLAESFKLPGQGGESAVGFHRQCVPRAEDPHDYHLRLCRGHSGRDHPPGAGAGVSPNHRVRDPAAVPSGAADAGPVPAERPGGGHRHRPGTV